MQISKMRFATSLFAAAGLAFFLTGCSPDVEHRGYMPKPGAFDQITTGMSKMEVEGIMGTPSTTASVQYKGDGYYYITQITTSKAFLTSETDRTVIAIRFNEQGKVKSYAQYGLQDGRVIDINTNATPVYGEDTSIISALLRTSKGARTAPMLQGKI
ncbi:outer membrane protein assembly factor BamE [Aestuariivirga sp.]|uniref:outer membrane protein assembly factor BamE domain-containing protein n=1 Tax=Aestuariivirga sp. TaxID=2650926 RepID=UPI0025BC69A6|nr:outer membrane protein assembly factor BamE [Aestuariivirga sp.]MCA3556023.1 outer membrane protein assembly factor BamE [Aestuariivirga sp.]